MWECERISQATCGRRGNCLTHLIHPFLCPSRSIENYDVGYSRAYWRRRFSPHFKSCLTDALLPTWREPSYHTALWIVPSSSATSYQCYRLFSLRLDITHTSSWPTDSSLFARCPTISSYWPVRIKQHLSNLQQSRHPASSIAKSPECRTGNHRQSGALSEPGGSCFHPHVTRRTTCEEMMMLSRVTAIMAMSSPMGNLGDGRRICVSLP
ncbi:hypothetical protein BP00DRAFT_119697 [Aspergillus indologenus CBS 114.80]|uniref:Uncharacterized protein n=1 Tax=Aspergillus indologenus CBS 114.80 TaxID=1450541 RepID=A0A2V5HU87_9EURO|nr:hypothetical protein BP00DRAFT_119697 [Aspergillus indologenus CBS 114.80]